MVIVPGAQPVDLLGAQRRDTEDHVAVGKNVGHDRCPGVAVGVVGGERREAGSRLDGDLEPGRDQARHGIGHQRNAPLSRLRLCGHTDSHRRTT